MDNTKLLACKNKILQQLLLIKSLLDVAVGGLSQAISFISFPESRNLTFLLEQFRCYLFTYM